MRGTDSRIHEREVKGAAPAAGHLRAARLAGLAHWLLLGLVLCAARLAVAADEESILDHYPGRMVDVGDHRLHLDCRGQGGPTVVFESGIGGFSLEWRELAAHLATHRRVCSYDRAGYGWSDPAPGPASAARSAEELHVLLARAGEGGPFLLVGHSYGGFILRWFARRHAVEVAGLVLLDSSAPEQFALLPATALPQAPAGVPRAGLRQPSLPPGYPAAVATTALHLMLLPKSRLAVVEELRGFAASGAALAAAPPLQLDAPLLVLSRGRALFDARAGGATSEARWRRMQADMTTLSRHASLWVAENAGHLVHLDRPDLVVAAVQALAAPAAPTRTLAGAPPPAGPPPMPPS